MCLHTCQTKEVCQLLVAFVVAIVRFISALLILPTPTVQEILSLSGACSSSEGRFRFASCWRSARLGKNSWSHPYLHLPRPFGHCGLLEYLACKARLTSACMPAFCVLHDAKANEGLRTSNHLWTGRFQQHCYSRPRRAAKSDG